MLTDGHANLGDWISTQPFQPVQAWETVEDGDTLQFGDSYFHGAAYAGTHFRKRLLAIRRCAVYR